MADGEVDVLLENLQQLLLYHDELVGDSTIKRGKDDYLRQIRNVVYEAEDAIDTYVTQAAVTKSTSYIFRAFKKPAKLLSMAKDVEKVSTKIKEICSDKGKFDLVTLNVGDGDPEEPEFPQVRQENIVGFEDEAEKLLGYLTEQTQHLDVVSIIGLPGLGKTTLAWKIFCDPAIQYEFPTRIWVYISQDFRKKDVFLSILRQFTRITEDMYRQTDDDLAQQIAAHLDEGKFLIVMDDVLTPEDWDKLKTALPKCNNMVKVLITSQNEDVARYANRLRNPHNLRFLTEEESWLLLQLEVFGKPECPQELEVLGKLIADRCDGLPLALVVIGGILVQKTRGETNVEGEWEKVSNSVSAYLNEDQQGRMERILSLRYNKLPFHLRACFLYFGMFPNDYEIPVCKLIRMWIAEGFIQQKMGGISLEETAENYLEDLISRNLVRVEKVKPDGKVKTCRIHDMLRDLCKKESERENFLQEIKKSSGGVFEPPVTDVKKYRRLCIHSNVSQFVSSKPSGHRVRSFACFSKEDINLPSANSSAIPAAFKLLRVLDVKPIKLTKIPRDFYHLVHLRYITLSINLSILPPAFVKLWNIQTLIVDTTSRTLEIKADIWKLNQLRYVKTNAPATLPRPSKFSKEGEKLQTLGTISTQSCTEEVLDRTRNLKRLGIRGGLLMLLDGKSGSFDSVGRLSNLEKLKLLNDVFPDPPSRGQLRGLPLPDKFPPQLRSLTLADTFLDWSQMSILGLLPYLEVLKLKENAFMGRSWVTTDGGFRNLEVLLIGRTNLIVWEASRHHFPRLKVLELQNCEELGEVPIGLAEIPSLELLKLYHSRPASASAKKIPGAREKKMEEEQSTKFSVLKLLVFPPDEYIVFPPGEYRLGEIQNMRRYRISR